MKYPYSEQEKAQMQKEWERVSRNQIIKFSILMGIIVVWAFVCKVYH